ncbi:MAG: hypothetical protein K5790_01595 [Nitrosopumilus sp.]|uniref:hypothetical protein n=1 Tax=Nitrosopumilus sp. TaxID=2024843 RepID=UPI00247B42C7|nr:hypothetical protein [Nitrosopumilus sp.]MCV0391967.1 hypothetical protein [Nitrosopumilus sp.]
MTLDLKILSTGIGLNFGKFFSYDEFTYALKNEGFDQKFYTIGRMIGTDPQGRRLKQNLEKNNLEQSSDKYNMIGKYCLAHTYGDMLFVGQNFTQDGGLEMKIIPNLTNEMLFVINTFWNTVKISKESITEGTLLAAITVSDNEKHLLSNSENSEYDFEDMKIEKYNDEVILNPAFHRGLHPKNIHEYIQSHPEVTKKTEGWGEIKVKYSDQQYTISFEYGTNNIDKMIDMIKHPNSYCVGIIQKFKSKY